MLRGWPRFADVSPWAPPTLEDSSGRPWEKRFAPTFRFAQPSPLPGTPKMSRETTATYGTRRPLAGSAGGETLHKEQMSVGQHGRDHTRNFTHVRAAVRRKTLLLLWWIDGGRMVVEHSTLARHGCLWAQWLCSYECVGLQPSNLLYGCHGPPFVG